MGSYRTWRAAILVFAYPENQLFPNLYVPDASLTPTKAFLVLIKALREAFRVTPELARSIASEYLRQLRVEVGLPGELTSPTFSLTDQMSDGELVDRKKVVKSLFLAHAPDPNDPPQYLREVFWLVPIALALRLQEERYYLTALDWFQTVYAFNLPPANRKIYPG